MNKLQAYFWVTLGIIVLLIFLAPSAPAQFSNNGTVPLRALAMFNVSATTITNGATTYVTAAGNTLGPSLAIINRILPIPGVISNLYVTTSGSQPSTGTLVCGVYKNSSLSSVKVTFLASASASTLHDSVDVVTLAGGDLWAIGCTNNAGTTSAPINEVSISIQ